MAVHTPDATLNPDGTHRHCRDLPPGRAGPQGAGGGGGGPADPPRRVHLFVRLREDLVPEDVLRERIRQQIRGNIPLRAAFTACIRSVYNVW